jgi:hypothetical protein
MGRLPKILAFLPLLLLSFRCVGGDSTTPLDGGADGTSSDATNDVVTGDASDAAPPLLSCAFAQQPGALVLGAIANTSDAGLQTSTLDPDRFALIPVSNNAVAVAGVANAQNGQTALFLYSPVRTDESSPSPNARPVTVVGNGQRPLWVGRIKDGLGILMWEQLNGNWGFSVYKVLDSDLMGSGTYGLSLSRRLDVSASATLNWAQDGKLLPLGVDDYFLAAVRSDQANTTFSFISARMNSATPASQETPIASAADVPGISSIVQGGSSIHVFEMIGNFPTFTASDVAFDPTTALQTGSTPYTDIVVSAAAFGTAGFGVTAGQVTNSNLDGLRVGTVTTLAQASVSALPLTALGTSELPFSSGGFLAWLSPPNDPPQWLAAGPASTTQGMNFLWFDGAGNLRARQTAKTTTLLQNVNHIAAVSIGLGSTFTPSLAQFPTAWVSRDDNTTTDTVYYGVISCGS